MTSQAMPSPHARPDIARVPSGRFAMWWVIASEIVIFGGLIASYVLYRIRYPGWAEFAHHTSTPLGALNTLVLLTSSYTVVLAHQASGRGDLAAVRKYLYITIGFGAMFLVVKSFEYTHEIRAGFTPTANLFWSFYYTMTGLHASHVIAGMIAMAVVSRQAGRGRHLHRVEMAGLYWHFVDVVWIFLFPLLYLAK
ncbi:MAG: cytochrome c oxidase subunit 3 [Gemmatimonadales bacterium]|nr:cytochrome c oxidase subunit 3 [Gemmatimonadales bacterium]MBP9199305.1 cytochrome c oxidase subunit 3 [Gemmatimonadales bacterium]